MCRSRVDLSGNEGRGSVCQQWLQGFCHVTRRGCTEEAAGMGRMWSQEWAFPLVYQESRASFP